MVLCWAIYSLFTPAMRSILRKDSSVTREVRGGLCRNWGMGLTRLGRIPSPWTIAIPYEE